MHLLNKLSFVLIYKVPMHPKVQEFQYTVLIQFLAENLTMATQGGNNEHFCPP